MSEDKAYEDGYHDGFEDGKYVSSRKHLIQIDQLKAENAKLRELCRMFAEYVSYDRCEGCVVKRRCKDGEIEECWQRTKIREIAHELRIEVE